MPSAEREAESLLKRHTGERRTMACRRRTDRPQRLHRELFAVPNIHTGSTLHEMVLYVTLLHDRELTTCCEGQTNIMTLHGQFPLRTGRRSACGHARGGGE